MNEHAYLDIYLVLLDGLVLLLVVPVDQRST